MRLASLTRFCAPYRARIVPLRHVAERRCLVLTGVDTLIFLTISLLLAHYTSRIDCTLLVSGEGDRI
jgi:hypothetical protein